jgi:hypothetical protein
MIVNYVSLDSDLAIGYEIRWWKHVTDVDGMTSYKACDSHVGATHVTFQLHNKHYREVGFELEWPNDTKDLEKLVRVSQYMYSRGIEKGKEEIRKALGIDLRVG